MQPSSCSNCTPCRSHCGESVASSSTVPSPERSMGAVGTASRFRIVFPWNVSLPVAPTFTVPFTVSSFAAALTSATTTITALTSHGRFRLPQPYSSLPPRDSRKVSLGHPVFLFRCSPCLITYVQSHCGSPCLLRSLLPAPRRAGLNHLTKTHPLYTPPRPNPLHAVALQEKTGRILGLRPSSQPPHGVPGNLPLAIPLDGTAGRSAPE